MQRKFVSLFNIVFNSLFYFKKGEVGQPGPPGLEGHRGEPVSH